MKQTQITLIFIILGLVAFWSCEENATESFVNVPELITANVSEITDTTAQCGGTISSDGGATVTARGVCWSMGENPTVADDTTNDGTGAGSFTSYVTGLTASTTYYLRAYATNSAGLGYGSTMSFTTALQLGTVTDIDGNVYQTIIIGTQEWMAENLKVTHYRDGTAIPTGHSNSVWGNLSTGAYCAYDNNESNADTYGYLYNWYAVDDSRNIAPEGWHVPTDDEIKQLEMHLGMSQSEADDTGYRGTNEGSKLAGRADIWIDGNLENNSEFGTSGFMALPGGYRDGGGNYCGMGSSGDFWSSTGDSSYGAWDRGLGYYGSEVGRGSGDKRYGFSVRCLRTVE